MTQKVIRKKRQARQLTLRGLDDELHKCIELLAKSKDISLNKAALMLLRKGAGLAGERRFAGSVADSLDSLIGKWSDVEEKMFLQNIAAFERVDESLWL